MDARSKKLNEPILDFDPVTDSQDPQVDKLTIAGEGDAAAVATFYSGDVKHAVRYSLVRDGGAWKVDDISGGAGDDKWDLRDIIKPPKTLSAARPPASRSARELAPAILAQALRRRRRRRSPPPRRRARASPRRR